ncbi:MAG: MBL fold metallo-hydrolase [Acidobacteria bacterium]|jgi:glyoxylase-like metal-dependent hydrolase (beta-lactamase superfamily II)|nr:MBL fold metallo-hydrolase [Acidobacteriota bacterium]
MSQDPVIVDLHFMDQAEVIATFLMPAPDGGFVLIESGPGSTLPALQAGVEAAGFALADLRAVLLTHIHLDHAGAAGELARRTGATVYAHPEGIRHLADPTRLLASAARLYREAMDFLWGRMEPVPQAQLRAVGDGETVTVGGLEATAWHTPGHARHHIAWQVGECVATGDVGGIRMPGSSHVVPPTPPPDLDLEAWRGSLRRLAGLAPRRLLVTHFGIHDNIESHLRDLEARLTRWWGLAEEVLGSAGDVGSLEAALTELDDHDLAAANAPSSVREQLRAACPMMLNAAGLVHAWSRS